jgi:hypothetical protein
MAKLSTFKSGLTAALMLGTAVLGFASAANADAIDDITKAGVLNVGVFADFPPFSSASADMSLKGYDIDVAQYIADALKVKLVPVPVTGQNRIPYLTEKRVDMLVSVGFSKERAEVIDFAAAYAPYYIAVIGPAAMKVKGKEDLAGKSIAVNRGTLEDTSLTEAAPKDRRHQAFRQLQLGDPGLHLRPDRADGRRQRCRRAGAGPSGSPEAGAEVPAPDLAVASGAQQGRRPPEGRRSTMPLPRCWPMAS